MQIVALLGLLLIDRGYVLWLTIDAQLTVSGKYFRFFNVVSEDRIIGFFPLIQESYFHIVLDKV